MQLLPTGLQTTRPLPSVPVGAELQGAADVPSGLATRQPALMFAVPYSPAAGPAQPMPAPAPGLMSTAKPALYTPPALGAPSTYVPAAYNAVTAGSQGYSAQTGTAQTYAPTKIDTTGDTYTPTTQTVNPNELTSTQLNTLLSSNNPYLQMARQSGLDQAARSGLMTSSIAAGNAQRAAIQAAEPIAQSDATQYANVASQNMAAQNTALQYNAGATLNAATGNANLVNQAGQFNANAANQMTTANIAAKNQAAEFGANASNQAAQFNANSANQAAAFSANETNQAGQFNAAATNQTAQFNASQAQQAALAGQALTAQQTNNWLQWQAGRENAMGQILASVYQNPNLTPAQQNEAANNAKTIYQGLWDATNQTFANGVPQIFMNV